jgi:hypothetical protein
MPQDSKISYLNACSIDILGDGMPWNTSSMPLDTDIISLKKYATISPPAVQL